MPTYNTTRLIDELQQQTETFLQQAIAEWQMTSPAKLLKQPGENKWSAAQCLAHLNSYGHYYLPAIEKAINTAKQKQWHTKSEYTAGWLGNYFTNLMKPSTSSKPMKKMKAPKDHTPAAVPDADKVVSEFIDQQEKLLSLLESVRSVNLAKTKVPISIAKFIRLQLGDVFTFLIAHNHRHVVQATKALQAAGVASKTQRAAVI